MATSSHQSIDLKSFATALESRAFPMSWPGHYVAGSWRQAVKGQPLKATVNPNNGATLMEVSTDKEAINLAVDSAFAVRQVVAGLALKERLEILSRFRQLLADYSAAARLALRIEGGKPEWEAANDVESALRYLEYVTTHGEAIKESLLAPANLAHAGEQGRFNFALMPIGVTAAYLPFSTPLTSFVIYFSAAMIAGCPLVINLSTHVTLSGALYALIAEQLDLKPGFLNFVFGNFGNSFKQIMGDKRIGAILYTGSREHCETIRREAKTQPGRQVVLQSGGKNAVIVHSSADLEHAVRCVVYGALKSGGQRCTSTSRVFVYRSISQEFRERLAEAFRGVVIGRTDLDSADDVAPKAPFMGPLYSEKAIEKYLRFQTMANREAEQTILWGKTVDNGSGGYFVTPGLHYMGKFDNGSAYQGNVLFSPDVAIYDYDVLETAIEQINTTDAAFAVSFIGESEAIDTRRHLFLAPNLLVNLPTVEMDATLPLGGRLQSGHNRFHGPGIALYLCYPQAVERSDESSARLRAWPWPRF